MASVEMGDLGVKYRRGDWLSSLSKNLSQVLSDKDALACFIQFMESRGAANLVKFWLDAETFKILNQKCFEDRHAETEAQLLNIPKGIGEFSISICGKGGLPNSLVSPQYHLLRNDDSDLKFSAGSNIVPSSCPTTAESTIDEVESGEIKNTCNVALAMSEPTQSGYKYYPPLLHPRLESDCSTDLTCDSEMHSIAASLPITDLLLISTKSLDRMTKAQENYFHRSELLKDTNSAVTAHGDYFCHANQNDQVGVYDGAEINLQVVSTVAGASGTTCRIANLATGSPSVSAVDKGFPDISTTELEMSGLIPQKLKKLSEFPQILKENPGGCRVEPIDDLHLNKLDSEQSSCNLGFIEQSTVSNENANSLKRIQEISHTNNNLPSHTKFIHNDNKQSGVPDSIVIFTKYLSPDCSHPIKIDERLRAKTIRRICREDGTADPQCFNDCQRYVYEVMDNRYFLEYLQSEYYRKHEIDLLTSSELHLVDILYNDMSLCYFTEFMEAENCMSVMQCFLDLDIFEKHLLSQGDGYDGIQAQEDAIVLYDKYFSLQATLPIIKFDDGVRLEVERNICLEGGPLPDCFMTPRAIIYSQMEQVNFPRFRESEQFCKYLSDLNKMAHAAQNVFIPFERKRAGSDVSSEKIIGSRSISQGIGNTLLAMDTRGQHMKKAISKITEIDMRIDSALFNPDSLWHRPNAGNMRLGHINDLGQFVSDFDPEPDHERKMQGTFFIKRKEKTKSSEEIALQAAQKIIDDIAEMTLFNNLNHYTS